MAFFFGRITPFRWMVKKWSSSGILRAPGGAEIHHLRRGGQASDKLGGFGVLAGDGVRVPVKRDAGVGVPHAGLHGLDVHPVRQQQGGLGVAKLVHLQAGESGLLAPNLVTLENSIGSRAIRQQDSLKDRVSADGLASLNEYELVAMRYVMSNGSITTKALSARIEKGARLCARTLRGLAEKGMLKWHGSSKNDPSQYYTFD